MDAYAQNNISNRLTDGCSIFFVQLMLKKDKTLILAQPKLGFLYSLQAIARLALIFFL